MSKLKKEEKVYETKMQKLDLRL